MTSPLFRRHLRTLLAGLALAGSAALAPAADRGTPGPAEDPRGVALLPTAGAFQFGPVLVPSQAQGGTDESALLQRQLVRVTAAQPAPSVPRRERPYAAACNFTTSCR